MALMAATPLSMLLAVVMFSSVLVFNTMVNGLEEQSDQFNLIKSRDEMCSARDGFVETCFEKGYTCELTGPQEDSGRFLLKMCKDDAFRNKYQKLTNCLDGYSQWSVPFHCPGLLFSALVSQDLTTCQSKTISKAFDCFRYLCPDWRNVVDTFKDGMTNLCSVGSFRYSYKIPAQKPVPTPRLNSNGYNWPVENVGSTVKSSVRSRANRLGSNRSFQTFVITAIIWALLHAV